MAAWRTLAAVGLAGLTFAFLANVATPEPPPVRRNRRRRTSRRRRRRTSRRRTSRNATQRKGPRTGLIELPEEQLDQMVQSVIDTLTPVPGTYRWKYDDPHEHATAGIWYLPSATKKGEKVQIEIQAVTPEEIRHRSHGRRGVLGSHRSLPSWKRGPRTDKRGRRRKQPTVERRLISIRVPRRPKDIEVLRAQIREVLAHELTHALDPTLEYTYRTSRTTKPQHEMEYEEYFAQPEEVTAFLRSMERELTTQSALNHGARSLLEPEQWAAEVSKTWNKIFGYGRRRRRKGPAPRPGWSEKDRRRALNVLARVWTSKVLPRRRIRDERFEARSRGFRRPMDDHEVWISIGPRTTYSLEVYDLEEGEVVGNIRVGQPLEIVDLHDKVALRIAEEHAQPITRASISRLPKKAINEALAYAAEEACTRSTALVASRKPSAAEKAFWDERLRRKEAGMVSVREKPRGSKTWKKSKRPALLCDRIPVAVEDPVA